MFVGHYSAALAAKGMEPRTPLWTVVAGCQLIDIGWSALVMGGIEKVRIDPSLPGSSLDLYYMPFTHSLPAAIIWSVAALVLARWLLKLPLRVAVIIGLVVFSHWALDFLVHRPDLLLWPGDGKVGLGWWNYPVPEQALEIGLLGLGGMWWAWSRGAHQRGRRHSDAVHRRPDRPADRGDVHAAGQGRELPVRPQRSCGLSRHHARRLGLRPRAGEEGQQAAQVGCSPSGGAVREAD